MKTESVKYDPSSFTSAPAPSTTSSYPFVPTETRTLGGGNVTSSPTDLDAVSPSVVTTIMEQGELITTQSITSKTRTVETVTVKL